jgi:hypothetical protein
MILDSSNWAALKNPPNARLPILKCWGYLPFSLIKLKIPRGVEKMSHMTGQIHQVLKIGQKNKAGHTR